MTNIKNALHQKKISTMELNQLKKIIEDNAFDLVGDYYGYALEEIDPKEKKKMKLKMIKSLERKICEHFKINQLKHLKWIQLVDAKMFVDDLQIHDIKQYE